MAQRSTADPARSHGSASTAGSPRLEGLKPLGISLIVPLALLPPTLATAGLGSVATAGLVGLGLGVPTARALRRGLLEDADPTGLLDGVTDLVMVGVLAGVGAALLAPLPPLLAGAVGLALWLGAGWLAGRDWRVRLGFGVAGGAVAVLLGLVALIRGPLPVTALAPQWSEIPAVLPAALGCGLWLGGLGGGQWRGPRRPGTARSPWTTAGGALLGGLGGAVWIAGGFEQRLVFPSADPALGVALALGWWSAASTWLASRRRPGRWMAGGALSTAWLAGPAAGIVGLLATAALPLLIALGTGLAAAGRRGPDRGLGVVATAVGLIAAALALADADLGGLGDAAALAVTVVAGFWFVATALVRRQKAGVTA